MKEWDEEWVVRPGFHLGMAKLETDQDVEGVCWILSDFSFYGWNTNVFRHMERFNDIGMSQRDNQLDWIIANKGSHLVHDEAADWLKNMSAAIGIVQATTKLSNALSRSQVVRRNHKTATVIEAVREFIETNKRWPMRKEIEASNVSGKTIDNAFQQIEEAFGIKLDGRERWKRRADSQ